MSEQPLTAEEEAEWRKARADLTDHPYYAHEARIWATLDAARAGVPGDEGLYEAVLAYRSMHEPLCKCPAAQAIDAYLAPRASIAIEASDD